MASNPPIATVYVQNLEERVKIEPLKEALNAIFSEYGTVVEIIAKTNVKAKGQAFVVLDSPEAARMAVEEIQGFELFDKPIRLALTKMSSDITVKNWGSPQDLDQHKRRRLAEKERKAAEAAEQQKNADKGLKGARASATRPGNAAGGTVPDEYLPPNKILFVQNFPEDYDIDALTAIFGRFDGFREVRLVPGRQGIAFVEYETEQGAITAKENTAGMAFGDAIIKVTYQRQ